MRVMRDEAVGDALVSGAIWALGVALVAGVAHIVSIFVMPHVATRDAYARIAALAPLDQLTLIGARRAEADTPPFEDPALAEGVCRYDLAQGPMRLRATFPPDPLMLLSFYGRTGQLYYSMTDRSATRGRLDVLVVTQAQLEAVEAEDSEDELPQELRILAPANEGFVLLRALAERADAMEAARARVQAVSCSLEKGAAG